MTYEIEVSYDDGRCYKADTDDSASAERAIKDLESRHDVAAFAVSLIDAGRALVAQVYRDGRCTVYIND